MKLTIERLHTLNAADLSDLQKIWPQQTPQAWQRGLDNGGALFVARFNDRLLAAVKVTQDNGIATLHDLRVREVTRRRGVGLYLVEDTLRQLPDIHAWQLPLGDIPPAQLAIMDGFMRACGFSRRPEGWRR
ncbi:aspartate 1-decarboxylase autocleavage activator PanM [Edwardsiella ictaluri]|uniref:PanD regulatory factor n=2 Tax=Edwardsiella ictaluri TaxID=67780 RepID=C5B985_EDWI9|nr:aspartate 1-decarboxylase autocleavage activator PanM [Edwardsiella ictaluri]ACR70826.1 hypothetical protein NT01EI_3698 [Edwardsiella ictaluri 93-146]ARD39689.1 aspartate 1-decarboxylase autocleavage activator PanM [Edwardsiella ictaluri]AVZ82389.1 aspartate 1-decarboxylase autocleavage activator PanM [Edwardsiella ictaluri]EKS7762927.1 aspartate 1-decarboxylase autocleavage activator PanM [Edwardsiella ictaluri]EKS7769839.1 aspartate 1-decarboxylase autocleavage activator PanM [Edwardsiel